MGRSPSRTGWSQDEGVRSGAGDRVSGWTPERGGKSLKVKVGLKVGYPR